MKKKLKLLGNKLYDYINEQYYIPSEANYCYIDKIIISYDDNVAYDYEMYIIWGRCYDSIDESKVWLNEAHNTIINVDFDNYNYDVILGQFIQAIAGDDR